MVLKTTPNQEFELLPHHRSLIPPQCGAFDASPIPNARRRRNRRRSRVRVQALIACVLLPLLIGGCQSSPQVANDRSASGDVAAWRSRWLSADDLYHRRTLVLELMDQHIIVAETPLKRLQEIFGDDLSILEADAAAGTQRMLLPLGNTGTIAGMAVNSWYLLVDARTRAGRFEVSGYHLTNYSALEVWMD